MTWGLVLSGGAAWGLANGGVVEVLESEGLRPDVVSGSSMGAIIGALYALGVSPKDMKEVCRDIKISNVAKVSPKMLDGGLEGGFLRQNLFKHLHPLVGNKTIADCKIPFVCLAAKAKKSIKWSHIIRDDFMETVSESFEKHVFPPQTRIMDAILASSAIPVLFSPVEVHGDSFVDIMSFGSIPARTLREMHDPDVIIATDTNPSHRSAQKWLPKGWREFIVAGLKELEKSRRECDLIIEPEFKQFYFAFHHAADFWKAGYDAAEEMLPRIRKELGARRE